MPYALQSAPQKSLTANPIGRAPTFSRSLCQFKTTSGLNRKCRRLQMSSNGFMMKLTTPAKTVPKFSNTVIVDEAPPLFPYHSDDDDEDLCMHIWWDFGRCPVPINFDALKIGYTIIDTVRRINKPGPIFFRGYGNVSLFRKMGEETLRILLESEFPLVGFQMINDFGPHVCDENLMRADLLFTVTRMSLGIHFVVIDGTPCMARALAELRERGKDMIGVHPEQYATEGVWHWEPLSTRVKDRSSAPYNGGPQNAEQDEQNGGSTLGGGGPLDGFSNKPTEANYPVVGWYVTRHVPFTFRGDKVVNIWWDVGECPLPSNFDSHKIASNLTEALIRNNIYRPIYLRVYGIIPEMRKDVVRFIYESGLLLAGFQLKPNNYYDYIENLMASDFHYQIGSKRPGIDVFISDANEYTKYVVNSVRENGFNKVISVHPESKATDGAWSWETLLA